MTKNKRLSIPSYQSRVSPASSGLSDLLFVPNKFAKKLKCCILVLLNFMICALWHHLHHQAPLFSKEILKGVIQSDSQKKV